MQLQLKKQSKPPPPLVFLSKTDSTVRRLPFSTSLFSLLSLHIYPPLPHSHFSSSARLRDLVNIQQSINEGLATENPVLLRSAASSFANYGQPRSLQALVDKAGAKLHSLLGPLVQQLKASLRLLPSRKELQDLYHRAEVVGYKGQEVAEIEALLNLDEIKLTERQIRTAESCSHRLFVLSQLLSYVLL